MRRRQQRRTAGGAVLILATFWLGCVESSWEATRRLDSVAAYNQFIRDHPDSQYIDDAQERMAFLRVTTYKTLEIFEEFQRRYPKSRFMAELLVVVEPLFFEDARAVNSPQAYREFLRAYPNGAFTAKARGNLAYVEEVQVSPTPAVLEQFLAQYPESDFAPEAERTLQIVSTQEQTAIRRMGIRVDVAPNVVQGDRVASGFASMIAQAYRQRGIDVVPLRVDEAPGADLDAWVRVDYHEAPATASLGGASLYSFCRVRLFHQDLDEPVWDRSFEAPAEHIVQGAYGRDKTLFGNSNYRFWKTFFVPVATWAVSDTRVQKLSYLEDVRAIHILGDHAALLLERGGVDFLDVSSPTNLKVAERYRREVDLADWRGVRLLRQDLALTFGNDGAELIRRTDQSATRVARWDAGELGAVRDAVLFDSSTLLIGASRGVYAVRLNRAPMVPQPLLDGEVVGLEVSGEFVFVIRPDRLEVALPKHLLQHITARRVALGRGFRAERVRRVGDSLLVFGRSAVAEVSIASPTKPSLLSVVKHEEVGSVADMVSDARRRYILGERGLQVAPVAGGEAEDFIQVGADEALTLKGRFALLVGQKSVEVLDLTPYYDELPVVPRTEALPAAQAPTEP